MNKNDQFKDLHFERRLKNFPLRVAIIGAVVIIFVLTWVLIPHAILFWLLLLPVVGIVWTASYGWRQVLEVVARLIHFLERL